MPTFLIALASALLLAALVTETVSRFFADSYLALMFITFSALLMNGLFNARLKQAPAARRYNERKADQSARSRGRADEHQAGAAGAARCSGAIDESEAP